MGITFNFIITIILITVIILICIILNPHNNYEIDTIINSIL